MKVPWREAKELHETIQRLEKRVAELEAAIKKAGRAFMCSCWTDEALCTSCELLAALEPKP